jgi:hypothetical protein
MVSRDAAQEEAAGKIAPGSRTIRSGFWNTLCPPRHCPAKTPFHNFLPQGTAAFKRQRNAYTPFRNESARIEPLGEESCQRAYRCATRFGGSPKKPPAFMWRSRHGFPFPYSPNGRTHSTAQWIARGLSGPRRLTFDSGAGASGCATGSFCSACSSTSSSVWT